MSVGTEYRIGLALLQCDRGIQDFDHELAALWNMKIWHVAGMVSLRETNRVPAKERTEGHLW